MWILALKKIGHSQYFQMKNDSFCTRSKAPTRQHDDSKSHSAVWDSFSVLSRFDIAASMATPYQVSILLLLLFWILPKTDPIWIILDSTPTLYFLFLPQNKKHQVERESAHLTLLQKWSFTKSCLYQLMNTMFEKWEYTWDHKSFYPPTVLKSLLKG